MTYLVGTCALYLFGAIMLQFLFRRTAYRWTIAFALSHTVVLLIVAADIAGTVFYAPPMYVAQVQLSWLPIMIMDFPVSMFRAGTCRIIKTVYGNSFEVRVVLCPLLHFGTMGTIQALVIGRCADAYFRLMD